MNATQSNQKPPTSVVIGNFDGLHLGHQALFSKLNEYAENKNTKKVLVTFNPHPREVLGSQHERFLFLSTQSERLKALEQLNLDQIEEIHFDLEFAQLTPEAFFEKVLWNAFNLKAVVVGYNFRFGNKQSGDVKLLEKLCSERGVECFIVPKIENKGEIYSSSAIRNYLQNGEIKKANTMLGYRFFYQGIVIHGAGRGGQIGIPTANLKWDEKLLLPYGVYATLFNVNDRTYISVTNIGVRPTFQSESQLSIETHIIDQKLDVYGKNIKLEFIKKLRDEKKFQSVDQLVEQIKYDILEAKSILM
jgi:riboflavin kinase/FMN adenylyltransferase